MALFSAAKAEPAVLCVAENAVGGRARSTVFVCFAVEDGVVGVSAAAVRAAKRRGGRCPAA